MEPVRLWAAVEFTARSGSTEALLTAAARAGLHLYGVTALPGGFCGHCAARQYPRLAALARRYRVRLRVRKKQGLYFRVRPLLRRAGLWAGLAVFLPLLLWTQQFVWFAQPAVEKFSMICQGRKRTVHGLVKALNPFGSRP